MAIWGSGEPRDPPPGGCFYINPSRRGPVAPPEAPPGSGSQTRALGPRIPILAPKRAKMAKIPQNGGYPAKPRKTPILGLQGPAARG